MHLIHKHAKHTLSLYSESISYTAPIETCKIIHKYTVLLTSAEADVASWLQQAKEIVSCYKSELNTRRTRTRRRRQPVQI